MFFWDGSNSELFNMFFNALGDSILSSYCGYFLFNEVDFSGGRIKHYLIGVLSSTLILLTAIGSLYIYHFSIYSLSGSLVGRFEQTFSLLSFQIFDLLTILFIGTTICIAFLKNRSLREREEKIEQLEEERKKAEISFLRSQMDPHFIFNTLNSIMNQLDESNSKAQEMIVQFSELIRFHLYEFQDLWIPLEKEVSFVKSYISIMNTRKMDHTQVNFNIVGELENVMIPPLLIIPIIENCFKHSGNHSQNKSLIDVEITVEDGLLIMKAMNSKKASNLKEIKGPGGIGLRNVEKRLQLYFDHDYLLKIDELEETYQLLLKVPIKDENLHT